MSINFGHVVSRVWLEDFIPASTSADNGYRLPQVCCVNLVEYQGEENEVYLNWTICYFTLVFYSH